MLRSEPLREGIEISEYGCASGPVDGVPVYDPVMELNPEQTQAFDEIDRRGVISDPSLLEDQFLPHLEALGAVDQLELVGHARRRGWTDLRIGELLGSIQLAWTLSALGYVDRSSGAADEPSSSGPSKSDDVGSRPSVTSRPDQTASRIARLGEYMSAHVLNADRMMICRHYEACSGSVRPHDVFDPGQLSFVGKNYDLTVEGAPVRIVVVGQEPGLWSPDGDRARGHGVTLEDRYKLIHDGSGLAARYYADGSHPGRNPHMRGTTSALRILLGIGLGTDHETEFIKTSDGTSFHLFDAFALVNVLLCAAGPPDSSRGRSTTTMQRNCLDHFAETVRILEPTILVLQGRGVQRWIAPKIKQLWTIADHVSAATIAGVDTVICSFTHPSAHSPLGWGSRLDAEYLIHTVQPALLAAITAQRAMSDPESMHENGGHQNEPEPCR